MSILKGAKPSASTNKTLTKMSIKTFLIIRGVTLFIALIAWTIYEMKNAYELPPDDPNF